MMTGLRVSGLAGGYGDLQVVRSVDFEVSPGRVTALLGRNGAGKTTTLRIIAGLNEALAGEVLLGGEDLTAYPTHRRVELGLGYVQEGKRIFRTLSVEENLIMGMYPRDLKGEERQSALERTYERFPILADRRSARAGVLSGGQQQMLAIAQALLSEPKVLLLDEPSGGLAPSLVHEIIDVLEVMRSDGLAVVLVEQAVDFALSVADTVSVLDTGRTTYTGETDDPALLAAIDSAYLGVRTEAG